MTQFSNLINHLAEQYYNPAVHFAQKLIKTPSLPGEEQEIAEEVLQEFNQINIFDNVYQDSIGNVIGQIQGRKSSPHVILNGHLDHVAPGEIVEWSYPPYSGKYDKNKIWGRGSVDMKCSLSTMLYGVKCWTKVALREKIEFGPILIIFVVQEELQEGWAFRKFLDSIPRPDLVILGEPSNLKLAYGHRGRAEVKIICKGQTAHASMPEKGINAVNDAAKLITAISQDNSLLLEEQVLGKETIACTQISCSPGNGPIIPDRAQLIIDFRIVSGDTPEMILERIQTLIDRLNQKNQLRGEVNIDLLHEKLQTYRGYSDEVIRYFPAWYIDPTSKVIQRAIQALYSALGHSVIPTVWQFSTDGIESAGYRNIPTLGFGPGNEELAHRPNENVEVAQISPAISGIAHLLSEFTIS